MRSFWLPVVCIVAMLVAGLPVSSQAGPTACTIDTMLVLDRSGSMNGGPAVTARAGAEALLRALSSKDQSGVRSFPATPFDKSLSNDHDASIEAVRYQLPGGLQSTGADSQAQAQRTDQARQDINDDGRAGSFKAIVVLSDGHNAPSAVPAAHQAQADGIAVFSIAIGEAADVQHMRGIASTPHEVFYHHVNTTKEAQDVMARIQAIVVTCGVDAWMTFSGPCAPGTWKFQDQSTVVGPIRIQQALWEFGDGSTATAFPRGAVQHIYEEGGTYTVNLTLENAGGALASISRTFTVPDCPPVRPEARFSCTLEPGTLRMTFRDHSSKERGDIVSWQWSFGDGSFSSEQHPEHTYAREDLQVVRLQILDSDGLSDTYTRICTTQPLPGPVLVGVHNVTVWEGQRVVARPEAVTQGTTPTSIFIDLGPLPDEATLLEGPRLEWQTSTGDAGTYGPIRVHAVQGDKTAEAWFMVDVLPLPEGKVTDADHDGVNDDSDNCVGVSNGDQKDRDQDGVGDACDEAPTMSATATADARDRDRDGIHDEADNCVSIPNPDQEDTDFDGDGDACDLDRDGDRIADTLDNCPFLPNPAQADRDGDRKGDVCDAEAARSGVAFAAPRVTPQQEPVQQAGLPMLFWGLLGVASLFAVAIVFLIMRRR